MKKKHVLTITIECESVDAATDILQKIKAATSLESAEVELTPDNAKTPERVIEHHHYPWERPWWAPYDKYRWTTSGTTSADVRGISATLTDMWSDGAITYSAKLD